MIEDNELKEKVEEKKELVNTKLDKILLKHHDLIFRLISIIIDFSIALNICSIIMLSKKDKEVSEEIRYEDIFYITNAPKDYSINDDDLITMDIRNTTRLLSNLKLEDLDIEKNEREHFIPTTFEEDGITYKGNIDVYTYYEQNNLDIYSLILLMNITSQNIYQYYSAIEYFSNDALYNYFNAQSEEEKNNINQVFGMYKKLQNDNITLEEKQDLKSQMLIEIFRISIKNLINYANSNQDFKLYSNIFLYNYIISVLFNNVSLNEESLEQIQKIEDGYINYLSRRYHFEENQISKGLKTERLEYELLELSSILTYGKYAPYDYSGKSDNIEFLRNLVNEFPLIKTIGYIHSYDLKCLTLANLKSFKTLER